MTAAQPDSLRMDETITRGWKRAGTWKNGVFGKPSAARMLLTSPLVGESTM